MDKKIMGTFAILIIGLSVAGIVYAHWTDAATIKGTVRMGSITFGFTKILDEWDAEDYNDYKAEKRTATTVCTMSDRVMDVHTGHYVNKTLTFTMVNATPEYWGINKFTVDNAGTIPVKIQSIIITLPDGYILVDDTGGLKGIHWFVKNETTGLVAYEIWFYVETSDVDDVRDFFGEKYMPPWDVYYWVDLLGLKGTQIDKLGEVPVELCVSIPETAQECHTYSFSMEIDAIQWNKYTP
jgi:hypothetical protein